MRRSASSMSSMISTSLVVARLTGFLGFGTLPPCGVFDTYRFPQFSFSRRISK